MNSDEKIKALIILDIIGRPAEHLIDTLNALIGDLEKEKGVDVVSKKIREPVPMKERGDFFTTFAEVEIDVNEISRLTELMFKYMPANIEIISPEMLVVANDRINQLLNDLVIKLHRYDEIARVMQLEKQVLFKKIKEMGGEIPSQVSPVAQIHQPGQEQKPSKKTIISKPKTKKNKPKKKTSVKKKSSKKSRKKGKKK
ncbi:MAG: hypothetical protein WDZ62_01755 [Candidatus Pacearchaeota archaeon]